MATRTNITLRWRELPSGKKSLFLDITSGGKRYRENLKLFLVPERNRDDKSKNRETMRLAEAVRAQRLVEVQNREFGFKPRTIRSVKFKPYFLALAKKRKKSSVWMSCLSHIGAYCDADKLCFGDINKRWIEGFVTYLYATDNRSATNSQRGLKSGTQYLYYAILRACLRQAIKDGIIVNNPLVGIVPPRAGDSSRQFLTMEELKKLAVTPCAHKPLKDAFLFSCLTGLRYSDIKKLTWGEVQKMDGYTRLVFKQKKTGGLEYLDITPQAESLMGRRGNPTDRVFADFTLSATSVCYTISQWVSRAGIVKHITFHSARHTFAVMMLDLGVDIYTVSKLLGHRELSTTQIYAKVLDKNKQKAVSSIPRILDSWENK